jgi:uncharacterized protein (DUF849 family)
VTTGFWALPDVAARLRAVDGWTVLPDFASVNWHEPGSPALARLLLSRGLGVQTRIGMEDALRLPDGSTASGNAALVSAAMQLLSR